MVNLLLGHTAFILKGPCLFKWQYSWFCPYLRGDDARLDLPLLSLDTISSVKLKAEMICAWWVQKEPRYSAPQQQRNRIPLQQSWYLPFALPFPALQGGQLWKDVGKDISSSSQLLETSPSPEGQRTGLPARPAAVLLAKAHLQEKVPHAADIPILGSYIWHRDIWAACRHFGCRLEQRRAARLPWQAFGQPSLLCPCGQHLLCFMCCGSWVRETHTSCSGLGRYVPPTLEQSSDFQPFSFNSSQVLLLSPRLQHPLMKISP